MAETHRQTPVTRPTEHARNPERQDVVVTGKTLKKDEGTISVTYNPGPGDPKNSEIFGKKVKAGEAVDVPARYADKVAGNPYLSTDGKKDYVAPVADPDDEQEEASFEDNVARERTQEYLEGRRNLPNSPPGEAERVARAQEQAAELRAAAESDDAEKPRRGRPPKDS
jgi:hypothetical protein